MYCLCAVDGLTYTHILHQHLHGIYIMGGREVNIDKYAIHVGLDVAVVFEVGKISVIKWIFIYLYLYVAINFGIVMKILLFEFYCLHIHI